MLQLAMHSPLASEQILRKSMEYRGIRYTIRAGIERGYYRAVIHPDDVEIVSNSISGSREDAELYARRMINRWLQEKSGQRTNKQSDKLS